jgi:DNA-binding response OmpR family regulator
MSSNAKTSVVVVEDLALLREELVHFLTLNGLAAAGVNCGLGLNDWLASQSRPPELAVLDINLPGEDGLAIARRLRSVYPDMGLVMLTARKSTADKVIGYESGADIYLTKPVSGEELVAALSSLQRRLHTRMFIAAWRLDLAHCQIASPRGVVGELSANETAVLAAMARAPDQIAESAQMLLLCADEQKELDKGYLEVLVSRLRRKLAALLPDSDTHLIRAVRGKGYQLLITLEIR